MVKELVEVLRKAETWPREDQEELAEYAREIEARRSGVYRATPEELQAIDEAERRCEPSRRRGGFPGVSPCMKVEYSNRAVSDLRKIASDSLAAKLSLSLWRRAFAM
jgi:hypothetical protein